MTPDEFLQLARNLLNGPTEAHWRTAVSRMYYGSFHSLRQRLQDWGFHIRKSDQAHVGLSRRLAAIPLDGWDALARDMTQLRSDRNAADYDVERIFPKRLAINCAEAAERISVKLHVALTNADKQQAIAAI